MKKLLLLPAIIFLLQACDYKSGSGNIVTEKRNPGMFSGIDVSGGFEVEIRIGAPSITVEADDNFIHDIQTEVRNGKLYIKLDERTIRDAHLKVFVIAPEINSINASSASNVLVKDQLKSDRIEMHASSGSQIESLIDAPVCEATASSGGEIKLSGKTRQLEAEASSGSAINADRLQSENTTVKASSGGNARVHASLTLNASASSGGNILYTGGANVQKSVSSGGAVNKQ